MSANRLHTVVHRGNGPSCLMVHGALGSRSYWNENLEALSAVCTPVVAELWGHGRSPSPTDERAFTVEGYVEQFELIREDIGVERWFTIGQSMGAALTLRYGLAHPDRVVAQAITNSSSAFADPDEWVQRNTDLVRPFADRVRAEGVGSLRDSWMNPSRSLRIPEPTRVVMAAEFEEHTAAGVAGSFAITNRHLALGDRVAEISRPTMLTVGTDEARFQPLVERARRIPGIEVVDVAASHAVNAQNGPDWNRLVVDFLRRHSPAA